MDRATRTYRRADVWWGRGLGRTGPCQLLECMGEKTHWRELKQAGVCPCGRRSLGEQ